MLVYVPAKLAAVDATRALLDRLSNDVTVAGDRELKHAVEFASKATQIERKIAVGTISDVIAKAAAAGVNLPALPSTTDGWSAWRNATAAALGAHVDASGVLGLMLGQRAFDLMFAWSRAERIAYLRVARADHPVLVEEASRTVPEVASAWADLDRAIASSGRPLLETGRQQLASWMTRAPAADAVKSPTYTSGAFAHMINWLTHIDMLTQHLAKDLDVPVDPPPSRPASPEEERLVAAIIANPDDDALRRRFAELAALRGDPRAEFVREQFAVLAGQDSVHYQRARQRMDAHPEWSAPLTALGARDVKFTRGFASEITIDLDSFVTNANQLFALAPITTVRVRGGLAGRGAELAAVPQLAKLLELDLAEQTMTDADLVALLQSSNLARLRALLLHQNAITAAGIDALAAATHAMPALTVVDLQLNRAPDPCDQYEFYDETHQHWVPTPEGQALEAKYGRLRWLHPGD